MMRPVDPALSIYFCRTPVDFRKSIDGLAAVVQSVLLRDPYGEQLFIFISRRRDKIKILYYERSGFVLWYKKLANERFHWPRFSEDEVITLTTQQLNWLLDGYDLNVMKPHAEKTYRYVV